MRQRKLRVPRLVSAKRGISYMQAVYLDRMSRARPIPLTDTSLTVVLDEAESIGLYNRRDMRAKP